MKINFLVLGLIASQAFASVNIYENFQSSYICSSGTVTDKKPVVQVGADIYDKITDNFNYHVGGFANYSTETIEGYYTKDQLFNETDLFAGIFYEKDKYWISLDYEYWYYPHIIGEDTQNVIHYIFSYSGYLIYTLGGYYYINDGYNYLFDLNPSITYKYKFNNNLSIGVSTGIYYRFKNYDHVNGFNSWNYKLSLSYKGISVFYKKWYQIDDRLDSDFNNNLANDCYGISLSVEF